MRAPMRTHTVRAIDMPRFFTSRDIRRSCDKMLVAFVRGKPVRCRHGRATVCGKPLDVTVPREWEGSSTRLRSASQDTGAGAFFHDLLAKRNEHGPPQFVVHARLCRALLCLGR